MDPFVRRLIERLHDPARPLSRNRHFHTFQTPEGQRALKTSRRLLSLRKDILACRGEGGSIAVLSAGGEEGERRVELRLARIRGKRSAVVTADELELLVQLPGVREALEATGNAAA
jgi:hypothetical protein